MNITYTDGLSELEFLEIEKVYGIKLPKEFRDIYSQSMPISDEFYNWRDFSEENVTRLKFLIEKVKSDIFEDIDDIDWSDGWGGEPEEIEKRNQIIVGRLEKAPKLIPICGHRYIVEGDAERSPVLSVVGADIIYYSHDLAGFLSEEKIPYGALLSDFIYVPFWTDIM
ncbi:hypothetical protein ACTGZQ_05435 [Streptococcus suis]